MPGMVLPNSRLAGERSYIYEEIDLGGANGKEGEEDSVQFFFHKLSFSNFIFNYVCMYMIVCI